MQKIVLDRLRSEDGRDPLGVTEARHTLDTAYAMIESQLQNDEWFAGNQFTIVECSAALALFYASIVHPFENKPELKHLSAYCDRLLCRPSVRRTLKEARPFFEFFPYRDQMPDKYLRD